MGTKQRLLIGCWLMFSVGHPLLAQSPAPPSMQTNMKYLSSDELRGRSVTDETIQVAARYIADRMREIGLKTDVVDGSPFQPVAISFDARLGAAEKNEVVVSKVDSGDDAIRVGLGRGMCPLAIGADKGDVEGRLVFVGYGITARELNYDDYAGVDVNGAIVVMIRKEPQVADPQSMFSGTRNSRHAFFEVKLANAIEHGAAAVMIVNDPRSIGEDVQAIRNRIRQEKARLSSTRSRIDALPDSATNSRKGLEDRIKQIDSAIEGLEQEVADAKRGVMNFTVAGQRSPERQSIPVVSIARDVIDQVLQSERGKSLRDIEAEIDRTSRPASVELVKHSVKLRSELKPTTADTGNVIGVIPGRGELADEIIVVGAHYDHVGMGGFGSLAPGTIAIHNGADDNASGTVAMLEIAARMTTALKDVESHRQMVFMAFTGEERGLLGSKFYVENPVFPLAKTAAMVNLDMVGRLRDNELTIYGTGSAKEFDALVDRVNQRGGFRLEKIPSGYGPSDHASFYQAGVPVLFFFTGLHNDYHRPTDDFDKINFTGLSRITDTVSEVTLELATNPQRPEYVETEQSVRNRPDSKAVLGVRLSVESDSIVISGVTAGGAAARAGLRAGDQLQKLGDREIKSVEDVFGFMQTRSPGQKVQVSVLREGQQVELTVRLDARPDG